MRVLGLDPGLRITGWGVIEARDNRLVHVADGLIRSEEGADLATRLACLHRGVLAVLAAHAPDQAAVEETFVNHNPLSTLKLGQARGAVLLAPALAGLPVAEYQPSVVKKAVVGTGAATKDQVIHMIRRLLPRATLETADAADALAVAICHAHYRHGQDRLDTALAGSAPPAGAGAGSLGGRRVGFHRRGGGR